MVLRADLHPYRLGMRSPFTTARGTVTERTGVLFELSEGPVTGWGEAAPMPGWSTESLDDVVERLQATVAALGAIGKVDDRRVDTILRDLRTRPESRAAVAGAVFDLRARRRGVALAEFLAPDPPTSIALHGLVSARDPAGVAAEAVALVRAGYGALKLKVGEATTDLDVARVAAARVAVGADVELRLDANGGWDVDTALETLAAMSVHDIGFCEEPVAGIDRLAEVGRASAVPVAIDESARSVEDVAAALDTRMIDVVVVKPQALGGPDLGLQAARLARDRDAEFVITSMVDSAVGVAHAAHVAAASGSALRHGLATSQLLSDDVATPPTIVDGRLELPAGPGLGVVPRFAVGSDQP